MFPFMMNFKERSCTVYKWTTCVCLLVRLSSLDNTRLQHHTSRWCGRPRVDMSSIKGCDENVITVTSLRRESNYHCIHAAPLVRSWPRWALKINVYQYALCFKYKEIIEEALCFYLKTLFCKRSKEFFNPLLLKTLF